ncbi:hypothetical protein GKC56_06795 [Neisseriaceae bacterium PsAf]|nr:hypothetical protein [Neisseriaceae bacterium PsAf]
MAKEVGLDIDKAQEVIESNAYEKEIIEDALLAHAYQIQGVPFFVFNQKEAISGAQPKEFFLAALQQIVAKEQ